MGIASPCKAICKMNKEHDICIGCYRNWKEKSGWGTMSEEDKVGTTKLLTIRRLTYGELQE